MNLNFGILWIEDNISLEERKALNKCVTEAGFTANIDTMPNGKCLEQKAKCNKFFHQIDLILLDYKLNGEKGDELAPNVRELFPSTTILFYSGSLTDNQLRNRIASKKVEGVYCSRRDRFIDRAGELIKQTASSLNRLTGMRGLAMQVVADCDDLMRRGVETMTCWDNGFGEMVKELDCEVLEFIKNSKKNYKDAMNGTISDRIDTRAIDSGKLHNHFRRLTKELANKNPLLLDDKKVDHLRELRKITSNYDPEVLQKRNTLGHAKESKGPSGWVLQGGNINSDDFPKLRQTFTEHIIAFQEMIDIIESLDSQQTK